jgi:hypothetical protein
MGWQVTSFVALASRGFAGLFEKTVLRAKKSAGTLLA